MKEAICAAAAAIRAGDIVAYPTEGVWGLGCDPANESAVRRLCQLKERAPEKGLILLAATLSQLQRWIAPMPTEVQNRIARTWPGPITWVVPAGADCPPWLTGGRETIAVRVSAHPTARDLAAAAGTAIVSTSANLTGEPPLRTAEAVRNRFGDMLAVIIDAPLGGLEAPTEIRDAATGRVLRKGAHGRSADGA